ncbi:MAG TPA: hypothetical protein VFZ63_07355 [Jiangellaceae bacterium]
MMDGVMGGVMGLMMLLFMLIAAGAVVVGAVGGARIMRGVRGRPDRSPAVEGRAGTDRQIGQRSPLDQAKERYARGEIDHAELDRLLDVLIKNDHRTGADR